MRIDPSSILFCVLLFTFQMEITIAESALLVTYKPNLYSYCQVPITASGIPTNNAKCTRSGMYFLDACVFYESDVIMFYEYNTGTIYKEKNHSHVEQRTWTRLHAGPTSYHTRIAFDWLSESLYWTDPLFSWIGVISIMNDDVGKYRIIVDKNIQRPHGITLDPFQGILFWTDIGQTVKIEKSNMSGDNRMVLISSGLITPYSIVADVRDERIFWIDDGRDTIESSQYDGTQRRMIRRINHANLFDIEVFKDLVYVSDPDSEFVYITNKSNGVIHENVSYANHEPHGIVMYHPDVQPRTGIDHCRTLQCSHICVSQKDGALCMCKEGFMLNSDGKQCSEDAQFIQRGLIVSNATSFCIADIHAISVRGYNTTCNLSVIGITHFELDTAKRELIFANGSGLYYTSINHLSVHQLLTVTGKISGLGFDWIDQTIFWSEEDTGNIACVSRLGSNKLTILSGLASPRHLLVLPLESRIFWVSKTISEHKIETSKFDGSDKRDVVQIGFSSNPASITFDPSTKRLYFVNNASIISCYLNGSDVRKLYNVPKDTDSVYVYKGYLLLHYRIYFNDMSEIISFEIGELTLTETYSTQIQSIGRITDLKVYDDRLQPNKKGPCEELNGGCEQICIVTGLVHRVCRCQFGFQMDPNKGTTCSSYPVNNNFLLVSDWTHKMIYQLSLDTNEVQAINIKMTQNPSGIAYDHTRKTVVWGSTKDNTIFSVSINGTDEMFLYETGKIFNAYPEKFAIDFSTRNIYYTAAGVDVSLNSQGGYIAVLSVNSLHKVLITGLRQPRDIVLYPSKGLMFWTDFGSNPHVGRAQMDGQENAQIINTKVKFPNGLALDFSANRLYWSDGDTDVIESCNLNGSDRREIFSDPGAHLMDIAFDNSENLYYIAWNRPYITKLMLSQQLQVVRLFEKPELGRLDALDIYTGDSQPRNPFCLYNNGNCSTFCLPNISGRTCSCEDGVSILEDGKTCFNFLTTEATPREVVTGENNPKRVYVGAGISAGFLVLLVVIVIIIWCIRKRTILKQRQLELITDGTDLQSIRRDENGPERPFSSISHIYDTIPDSPYDSDPAYLTVVP